MWWALLATVFRADWLGFDCNIHFYCTLLLSAFNAFNFRPFMFDMHCKRAAKNGVIITNYCRCVVHRLWISSWFVCLFWIHVESLLHSEFSILISFFQFTVAAAAAPYAIERFAFQFAAKPQKLNWIVVQHSIGFSIFDVCVRACAYAFIHLSSFG